jgi:hypothetical protein
MRPLFLFLSLLLPLGLTGCAPSRAAADSKLAVACEASIKAVFADPKENIEVEKATFKFVKSYEDLKLRVVTLKAKYTYGDSQPDDKTYTCSYAEDWSLISWLPQFYNLEKEGDKYGNFNGSILGDPAVLIKINEANTKVLN